VATFQEIEVAVSVATFKAEFEMFDTTADSVVQSKLDEALICTPERIWGSKQDLGIKYLTAHLLSMDPQGMAARKRNEEVTVYSLRRRLLEKTVSSGFRVSGDSIV
jgi:hypothetical protein